MHKERYAGILKPMAELVLFCFLAAVAMSIWTESEGGVIEERVLWHNIERNL